MTGRQATGKGTKGRRFQRRWLVLGAVVAALLIVGSAIAFLSPVPDDHSAWRDGNSDLRVFRENLLAAGYETRSVAASPMALESAADPSRSLVVVAGVERPYRETEIDALENFVREGGRLLVLDDTGNANTLSARFSVYFSAVPVLDENYRANLSLVNVTAKLPRRGGDPKVYSPVVMNVPTSLSADDGVNGTILASTSDSSFGDLGRNRQRDSGDLRGPFTVALEVRPGAGRVVFVADPDVLASDLVGERGVANAAFTNDLVLSLLPDGGTVLFDESRHGAPLVEASAGRALSLVVAATRDPVIRWVSLAVALAAGVALVALVPGEERLGHHAARLDAASGVRLDGPGARLHRAARAKIRIVHGARPGDDPVSLSTDPVLAKAAGSENAISPDKDLRDVVQRLRAYGAASRGAGRGPP